MKKLFIITSTIGLLFLTGCQNVSITSDQTPMEELTGTIEDITGDVVEELTGIIEESTGFILQSFEDCINAGFPIMESYPRQCNDGKNTYVEEIENTETNENTGGITKEIQDGTGTNLSVLQEKLKAMMERRTQQTEINTGTNTGTIVSATKENTTDDGVTEEDIENLESIIDEIIKK